ncbi:hypothetical protein FDP41_011112 [Naegleria fowleri]|uniref:Uncharacterized protein n=1 Tax=Naegleria fowleri TaxID=5763 RepID=A0A6A5C9D0_NAEFO|nr:uncharacterized protein FDP41_011112 [Naegleria fowleri]KAF0983134.1 hypothetical protein FDP41_011112 [Naegleria fowleri]
MRRTPPLTIGSTAINSRSNSSAPINIHNTRYSPTKIQKPKKTSPSKFLSPKTLMNSARLAAATSQQVPAKQCFYYHNYGRGVANQQPQVKILTDQPPHGYSQQHTPFQQFSSFSNQQTKYGHQGISIVTTAAANTLDSTTQRSSQICSNRIGTTQNKQLQEPKNQIFTPQQQTNCLTSASQQHHRHYHHHFANDQQALTFQHSLNYRILNPQSVVPSSEIYSNNNNFNHVTSTMGQRHSTNHSNGCFVTTATHPACMNVSSSYHRINQSVHPLVHMKSSSTSSLPIPTSTTTPLSMEQLSNVSANSSLASIATSSTSVSAISTRSSVSSNTSSLSIGSDVSDSLKYNHDPRVTTIARSTWNVPTTSTTLQQSSFMSNGNTNSNPQGHGLDKKAEPFSERKPALAMEPSIKEDEIMPTSTQNQASSIHNKQLGLMWSPTKLQRAQERTKRQILSVLLSPSSSEDDEEEEEIFAKIQQRYNEATLRINSIINSTLPVNTITTTQTQTTNVNNINHANQTTIIANPQQQKQPQPKAAPQLSSSAESNGSDNHSRSRPLTFKTQNLTSSLQQEKDRIEGLYLPPIVFPPKNVQANNFEIQEDKKLAMMLQQEKCAFNNSFESSCSSVEYATPKSSTTEAVQQSNLAHRYPQINHRYSGVVNSMLDTLFENCEEERTIMFDDGDDDDLLSIGHSPMFSSPSSLGMEECSLSSYGEESPALSPESLRQEALKMERELFFDRVPPEARLKIDDFSVQVRSFGQTTYRHIPIITLVAHCLNQIFLNGSKATSLFLERMMSIVCDRAEIDHRCLLSALFFMVKLQNPSFIHDENNMSLFSCDSSINKKHQVACISTKNFMFIFHVCLMISSKINEDNYYNNKTFFKYMAPNEFRLMFHAFNMDMAFDYMPDMRRVMVKEDGSVPIFPALSCSERFHSQTLANEHQKKLFQQFNTTEVNITRMLNYEVCVKEQELYNFLHKLERVNESLFSC